MTTWYSKAQSDTLLAGKDAAGAAASAQAAAIAAAASASKSADTIVDGTTNKAYTATEKTKLAGVASAATANRADSATDALLAAKADLVGGLVPTSQIPALSLVTAVPVANQAAMLALTTTQVQPGDLAVRADGAGTFILNATDPTQLGNWVRLNAPTDAVTTVNGQAGTVVLAKTDVGLGNVDNTADTAKPVSIAQQAALDAKAALASPALTGTPTVPTAAPGTATTQAASTAFVGSAITALSLPTAVTKRATVIVSGPGTATGTLTAGNGLMTRLKMTLTCTPTRYRVRIRAYSSAQGLAGGPVTLNAVAIGAPAYTSATGSNRWDGSAASTTQTMLTLGATAIDGTNTDVFTNWQTNAGEISANSAFLVSVGVTNNNGTASAIYSDAVGGFSYVGGSVGATANVTALSPTGTHLNPYLDIRLEVEYPTLVDVNGKAGTPIGLLIGDSITSGLTGDTALVGSNLTQEETWPGQASLRNKFVGINLGIAQKKASDFVTNWAAYVTGRVDLATTVPDFAIIALGINDVKNGASATTTETNLMTIISNLRALGIQRIFLSTIIPGGWATSFAVTGTTANASPTITAIPTTTGIVPGMSVTGTGVPASTTVLSVDSPTQLTLSANATAAGTAVTITFDMATKAYIPSAAIEAVRTTVNQWMSKNPYGVQGVLDFDKALRLEAQPGMADPNFISVYPHPDARGYSRMGSLVTL